MPPEIMSVAVPSVPPLQVTSVVVIEVVITAGSVIVSASRREQPLESITRRLCAPPHIPVSEDVVIPFVHE